MRDLLALAIGGARNTGLIQRAATKHHPNGFVTSDEFVSYVTDAIDALREEGARGAPKLLNIGYHLRIAGRPAHIATLTHVLGYLRELGDEVWIARRDSIARYWRDQFPADR